MTNFFKRALAIIAVAGGAMFASATPALANANTSVICGWDMQDPKTGARYAFYYRNDLTAKSQTPVMSDDQWQRAQCDGYDGKKGAIDQLADVIVSKYGSLNGWAKKRYETTWADRCNDSDYIAIYFGLIVFFMLSSAFRAAGDKRHVYVSNRVANTISKIDLQTFAVVDQFNAPGGPDCMEVAAGGKLLMVTSRWARKLTVIDTETRQIVRQVPVGKSPHGVWTLDHVRR